MATIKVKFRPSTVEGKAGTVYYQLTHRCEKQQITTDIRLMPGQWENVIRQPASPGDGAGPLKKRIDNDLIYLGRIIDRLEKSDGQYTVHDIARQWRGTLVMAFMQARIDRLYRCKCMGTARNYKSAFNSFSMFRQGKDLPFVAITEEIIEEYNSFLTGRGVSRNTISFYMRTMRAVYNKAVRERLVEQTYPFRNVYTGIDRTRKRAVDESVISKLLGLDLMKSRSLEMARDLFLFSFCCY